MGSGVGMDMIVHRRNCRTRGPSTTAAILGATLFLIVLAMMVLAVPTA